MATVTFTGDPRGGDNPASCEMHGLAFPFGEPVHDVPPAIAAKMERNAHFRVEMTDAGENVDTVAPIVAPRRRGRPPKIQSV